MTRSTQRFILALGVITLGAVFSAALIFVEIPPENEPVLTVALGLVLGWGSAAIGFFFGTSETSVHKSDILQSAIDRNGPSPSIDRPLPYPEFGDKP